MLPVLSLLVVGAGLLGQVDAARVRPRPAVGMLTGAYSSIFVAAPLLAAEGTRDAEVRGRPARAATTSRRGPARRGHRRRRRRALGVGRAPADARRPAAADADGGAGATAATGAEPARRRDAAAADAAERCSATRRGRARRSAASRPADARTMTGGSATWRRVRLGRAPMRLAAGAGPRRSPTTRSPGVTFRDITPLLGDADGFRRAVDELADRFARRRGRPGGRRRGPRVHPRRAGRLPPRRRRSCRCARPASCRGPWSARSTSSSTAPTSSRSTATPSTPASGSW